MIYKVETSQFVGGYRREFFKIEANSKEEAITLIESHEVDAYDGYIDVEDSDELTILNIEED